MHISEKILNLKPYQPGKPIEETKREYGLTKVCKLASNENPIGPSPRAIEAIQKAASELHRYPDGGCYDLRQAMSAYFQLEPSWIIFGNGSNELIDLLIRLYCEPGDSIVTSQAAFIAYKLCALGARVNVHEIPMTQDLRFDIKAFGSHFRSTQTPAGHKVIFISNPNNPTGTYLTQSELEGFLDEVGFRDDLVVVLDEAYFEYVRAKDYPSGLTLMKKYPNVVVLRTMSKVFGLAGLRLGVLLARPEVVDFINRIRNPFNVNSLAQVATIAAIQDREHLKRSQEVIWNGLDYFYRELERLKLPYVKSQGNFLLFDTLRDAQKVSDALLRRGVIVRPIRGYGFEHHLRLSVGLESENKMAISALTEVLGEIPPLTGSRSHN